VPMSCDVCLRDVALLFCSCCSTCPKWLVVQCANPHGFTCAAISSCTFLVYLSGLHASLNYLLMVLVRLLPVLKVTTAPLPLFSSFFVTSTIPYMMHRPQSKLHPSTVPMNAFVYLTIVVTASWSSNFSVVQVEPAAPCCHRPSTHLYFN
jgi:hypothetical protein